MIEIGVFGGTFNPVHIGELKVARRAVKQIPLQKIIWVPNGNPPHKSEGVLEKELRFKLLSAAVAGEAAFEVSRLEIDRPGLSWSIDTLAELKKVYPDGKYRLNFMIGQDNLRAFEQYDRRAEFFKLARLLVAPRKGWGKSDLASWRKRLPEAEIVRLNAFADSVSSTEIRSLILQGADFSHLVPAEVYRLICELGLYKNA